MPITCRAPLAYRPCSRRLCVEAVHTGGAKAAVLTGDKNLVDPAFQALPEALPLNPSLYELATGLATYECSPKTTVQ